VKRKKIGIARVTIETTWRLKSWSALNVEGFRKVVMLMFGYISSQKAGHRNIIRVSCSKNKKRHERQYLWSTSTWGIAWSAHRRVGRTQYEQPTTRFCMRRKNLNGRCTLQYYHCGSWGVGFVGCHCHGSVWRFYNNGVT